MLLQNNCLLTTLELKCQNLDEICIIINVHRLQLFAGRPGIALQFSREEIIPL